jgi:putative transposase
MVTPKLLRHYAPPRKTKNFATEPFKSNRQAQRFLAAHDGMSTIFRPRRYRLTAKSYRHAKSDAFGLWTDYATQMAP